MDNKVNPFQPNLPPISTPKPIKTQAKEARLENEENSEIDNNLNTEKNNSLNSLFQLPPNQVIKRLTSALNKYSQDPKLEKLLLELKISPTGKQAIAFCTFACLKDLIGNKLKLTEEDEKNILEALKNEYEADTSKETIDPDEKKKRKKERKKKNKPKINALISLIEDCMSKLEQNKELNKESSLLNIKT